MPFIDIFNKEGAVSSLPFFIWVYIYFYERTRWNLMLLMISILLISLYNIQTVPKPAEIKKLKTTQDLGKYLIQHAYFFFINVIMVMYIGISVIEIFSFKDLLAHFLFWAGIAGIVFTAVAAIYPFLKSYIMGLKMGYKIFKF